MREIDKIAVAQVPVAAEFIRDPQSDRYNGEGTVFGSINRDALNKMELVIPPLEVMDTFETVVSPIDEAIKKNYEELSDIAEKLDSIQGNGLYDSLAEIGNKPDSIQGVGAYNSLGDVCDKLDDIQGGEYTI